MAKTEEFPKALIDPDNWDNCVIVDTAEEEAEANAAGYWFRGEARDAVPNAAPKRGRKKV